MRLERERWAYGPRNGNRYGRRHCGAYQEPRAWQRPIPQVDPCRARR